MPELPTPPIRERQRIPEPEEIHIDHEKYRTLAHTLYNDHKSDIENQAANRFHNTKIDSALRQFPKEILQHYWGHGVTRGSIEMQIASALKIIEHRVMIGDAAPLKNSGYANAYTNGSLLVLSRKGGMSLIKGLEQRMPERVKINTEQEGTAVGLRIDPGAFVLNGIFESLIEPLRKMFPEAKIISADELVDYIKDQENKK